MDNPNLNDTLGIATLLSPVAFVLMYLMEGYFNPIDEPVTSAFNFAVSLFLAFILIALGYMVTTEYGGMDSTEKIPLGKRLVRITVLILVFSAIALTYGNREKTPTNQCHYCDKQIEQWLTDNNNNAICVDCFSEEKYKVCADCGCIYQERVSGTDFQFCDDCALDHIWVCGLCEGEFLLQSLSYLGDGYYACADCVAGQLDYIREEYEAREDFFESPSSWDYLIDYIYDWPPPRDEYLAEHKKAG